MFQRVTRFSISLSARPVVRTLSAAIRGENICPIADDSAELGANSRVAMAYTATSAAVR